MVVVEEEEVPIRVENQVSGAEADRRGGSTRQRGKYSQLLVVTELVVTELVVTELVVSRTQCNNTSLHDSLTFVSDGPPGATLRCETQQHRTRRRTHQTRGQGQLRNACK